MSLASQSQQWFPTSVQVTVHQARSLRIKGKNGTNDAYAIIQVAKDKFSTSVAEKCVGPVWKEEASFDLPLFHPGNAERCTLYIIVMHRAQVGLDKFLGQAVINLLDLHDNSPRKKTDWFKLVDKMGKEDKERGEVLLDIQFMRNNMSASMLDLSLQDKPRSRIAKLKDKVRGKKKDGFSDSASAIVPSLNKVLTDSEGEADAQSLNQSTEGKKKSKLKTLFAPKSNLQRNISQSMSTLGTFPEKNSSLSGSRSSGLNVDSPDVKKKFKFLGHKRTGSSDSKVSQGPFSLLGRSKQSSNDLNNLCINGNHVYTEEAETKSGSTLSLNSSGQGSVEDVHKHPSDGSSEASKSIPVPSIKFDSADRANLDQQHHREEEERRQAEERHIAEAKRLEEEEKRRAEARRLQEEEKRRAEAKRLQEEEKRRAEAKRLQEEEKRRAEAKRLQEEERRYQEEQARNQRFLEDETKKKKQREEEEERIIQEEKHRMLEAVETQKLEDEHRKVEEQKRLEEASMSERLTSLFGMMKRKEDKKEEVHHPKEGLPTPAPRSDSQAPHQPTSQHSTNPFEDISLSSQLPAGSNKSPSDHQKSNNNTQIPSAMANLSHPVKVSAVKPRLSQYLDSESADCQNLSQLCPSPADSTLSSVPSESPDTFTSLHSSLAPPHRSESLFGSDCGSIENLSSVGSSPTMADQKKKGSLLPMYSVHGMQPGKDVSVREIVNPAYVESDGLQHSNKAPLPLPDYETLFPNKRHGVQGQTKWDHVIAEVNQKHRDTPPQFLEMNVDGPEEQEQKPRSSIEDERPIMKLYKTKPISTKTVAAPAPPPKPVTSLHPQSDADSSQKLSQITVHQSPQKQIPSPVKGPGNTGVPDRENPSGMSKDEVRKILLPSPDATLAPRPSSQIEAPRPSSQIEAPRPSSQIEAPRPSSQIEAPRPSSQIEAPRPSSQIETTPTDDQRKTPMAKPRQRVGGKEPVQQDESASNIQKLPSSNVSTRDKKSEQAEDFADFNPFPSSDLLPKDPWEQPIQNQEVGDIFTSKRKEQKPEDRGLNDDFNDSFSELKTADPFAGFSGSDSNKHKENRKKDDDLKQPSPVFQRRNSPIRRKILMPTVLNNKGSKLQEKAYEKGVTITTASQDLHSREVATESATQQPQADVKAQSSYNGRDLFGAEPFTVSSGLTSSQPIQVVLEEPASQSEGLSAGKTLLQARVLPSEIPAVSAQNSNGSGVALTLRRPHPVKPLNAFESQRDIVPQKIKMIDAVESGPYTQLTQEELITLVVKQQTDLSKKDAKIMELEEYIDNLLVRVIDEKPSILQALNSAKPV